MIVVLISFILVWLTPFFIPTTVSSQSQLYEVRFGAPFPFIEQTSWLTPFEEDFPLNLTVLSPWENPTRILPGNMVLSVISISVMLLTVTQIICTIYAKVKAKDKY